MTGGDSHADQRRDRAEGRRRVARTDAALDLARSNRDFLAADIADRLDETGARRARTAHRYAVAEAAYNYALAVHTTTLDEAGAPRTAPERNEPEDEAAAAPLDSAPGPSRSDPTPPRPIAVSVLPGAPLVESGFWALLKKYDGRVVPVPLGHSTDVVVAVVTPAGGVSLPPWVEQPTVAIVPDPATASLVSRRGAVAVPMATTGAQLMAVLETIRTLKPTPRPTDRWAGAASPLSPREAQVITLICTGLSNPQIAAELYLGANSIKTYVRTAYRKIGVTRRTEAVMWGHRHGYGTTPADLARKP